jgi:hypothetical protein
MPCSGRTFPVPHFGPPMAPRRIASADLAASRACVVRGSPVASIEACVKGIVSFGYERGGRSESMRRTPPSRCSWKLNLPADGRPASTTFKTYTCSQLTRPGISTVHRAVP